MNIKPLIRTWDLNEDKPYFERQWWSGYLKNTREVDRQMDKAALISYESYLEFSDTVKSMSETLSKSLQGYIVNTRGLIDIVIKTDDEQYRPVVIIGGYWSGATYIEPTIDIFENEVYTDELGELLYDALDLAKLLMKMKHIKYLKEDNNVMDIKKTVEDNSSMEVGNISEFYDKWFAAHQEYVNDGLGYDIKLVKNDNEYLNIQAFQVPEQGLKHIRLMLRKPLDFKVAPDEFNKLLFMLSVIYRWEDGDQGRFVYEYYTPFIKFIKKSRGHLLGEDYCQLFDSYYDYIKDIDYDAWLHEDKARWLKVLTEAWSMLTDELVAKQHDSESNSDNYYTDDSGQDMFAKFEALDDFREQTYALGFCYHNIEKYLVRAGRKTDDPTADINKALDYLHEYRKLQKIYFE